MDSHVGKDLFFGSQPTNLYCFLAQTGRIQGNFLNVKTLPQAKETYAVIQIQES